MAIKIKPSNRNTNKHTEAGMELDCRYADVIVKRMLKLDKTLKIKKNGIDETETWLKLIE